VKKSLKRKLYPHCHPYPGDTPKAIHRAYQALAKGVFAVLELDSTDEPTRALLTQLSDEIWNHSANQDYAGFAYFQLTSSGHWKARDFATEQAGGKPHKAR
jgi:hypothetical protein